MLTKRHLAVLRMYTPRTYGIALGNEGREMTDMGLLEWRPPVFGSVMYAITEKGKAVLASQEPQP